MIRLMSDPSLHKCLLKRALEEEEGVAELCHFAEMKLKCFVPEAERSSVLIFLCNLLLMHFYFFRKIQYLTSDKNISKSLYIMHKGSYLRKIHTVNPLVLKAKREKMFINWVTLLLHENQETATQKLLKTVFGSIKCKVFLVE